MVTLMKMLGVGLLVLLALHVIGSVVLPVLLPILIPIVLLAVALSIVAVPVALIALLGWFVMWAWGRLEGEAI